MVNKYLDMENNALIMENFAGAGRIRPAVNRKRSRSGLVGAGLRRKRTGFRIGRFRGTSAGNLVYGKIVPLYYYYLIWKIGDDLENKSRHGKSVLFYGK